VPLGIRILAEHDNGHVGRGPIAAISAQNRRASDGRHGRPDPFENRRGAGKVRIRIARALPCKCPAALLLPDVVGAVSGDQHVHVSAQRQEPALILEQHERLSYGLARDRPMLRSTDQRTLIGQRAR